MTDAAIRNAERERDALAAKVNAALAQIEDWKRDIARVDQFISDWHRFAGTAPEVVTAAVVEKPAAKRQAVKNSSKEEVARVTQDLIAVHGRPIQRPVLLNLLRERGLVIEGADPETVLSTMLWRMGKEGAPILHLKGIGYWDSEKDWPEAGHLPSLREKLEAGGAFRDLDQRDDPRDQDVMHDAARERALEEQHEADEAKAQRLDIPSAR